MTFIQFVEFTSTNVDQIRELGEQFRRDREEDDPQPGNN